MNVIIPARKATQRVPSFRHVPGNPCDLERPRSEGVGREVTGRILDLRWWKALLRFWPLRPWSLLGTLVTATAAGVTATIADPGILTWPSVPGLAPSDQYVVRVRPQTNETAWQPLFAWQTTCGTNSITDSYFSALTNWTHTYVNFTATIPVIVEISRADASAITNAAVHPARMGGVTLSNGKAYISLGTNCNVAVDINGQMDLQDTGFVVTGPASSDGHPWEGPPIHTISLHNNPPLNGVPATNDPSVHLVTPGTTPPTTGNWSTLYFLPGVHNVGIAFPVHAGKSYYIPGDALVYGSFHNADPQDGHNIRIFGYGTLSQTGWPNPKYIPNLSTNDFVLYNPIDIADAFDTSVEGITIADPCFHSVMLRGNYSTSKSTLSSWVKVFGWRANGDGINPFGNGTISNCFLRTQDDSCYVNGVGINDTVYWNDANGSSFVLTALPELTNRTLVVRDCDVIYTRAQWIDWTGGRVFNFRGLGGGNCGSGVLFTNIHIEDPRPTMQCFFGCLQVPKPYGSGTRAPGDWAGTIFRNITITATNRNAQPEILWGHSGGTIQNLIFDNLTVGGVTVLANIFKTNEFVSLLQFTNSNPVVLSMVSNRDGQSRLGTTNPGCYVGLGGTNGQSIFAVTNNGTYTLQARSDLSLGSWLPMITNTAPFTFTEANQHPQQFYQIEGPHLPDN